MWDTAIFKKNPLSQVTVLAFPLTDHLPRHEDEADAAGDVQLLPGQSSGVTFDPRHGARHLAELLGPPQADHTGEVFTRLRRGVWTPLLWSSQPEGGEKSHWILWSLPD